MATNQRKPSIQPRPTKASQLRLQKQQASGSGLVTASATPTTEVEQPKTRSAAISAAGSSNVGPTDGVKAFMAQQRARIVKKPTNGPKEEEAPKRSSNIMTGAQRYGSSTPPAHVVSNTRNIQIIIKQSKAQGKLNISSRGLTKIPEEVIKMYGLNCVFVLYCRY
jgi:hypothetical protein